MRDWALCRASALLPGFQRPLRSGSKPLKYPIQPPSLEFWNWPSDPEALRHSKLQQPLPAHACLLSDLNKDSRPPDIWLLPRTAAISWTRVSTTIIAEISVQCLALSSWQCNHVAGRVDLLLQSRWERVLPAMACELHPFCFRWSQRIDRWSPSKLLEDISCTPRLQYFSADIRSRGIGDWH